MGGGTGRQTEGQTDRQMEGKQTDGHADKQNEWQKDERIGIRMEGQTDTWRGRYGQKDRKRQTEELTDKR